MTIKEQIAIHFIEYAKFARSIKSYEWHFNWFDQNIKIFNICNKKIFDSNKKY